MKKILSILLVFVMTSMMFLTGCGNNANNDTSGVSSTNNANNNTSGASSTNNTTVPDGGDDGKEKRKAELMEMFLSKANEVEVTETSVIFADASSDEKKEIKKNPEKVVSLYASFTTLWYEAGGTAIGCIGGDSSIALYQEYIGRDITIDEGMTVVATSSSGKKWDVETIVAMKPSLIICSTAMSGYSTIESPAAVAGIPVIAMDYNNFNDYLKWFKVFCNLNGQPELWDSVAMPVLEGVVDLLVSLPTEDSPSVLCMFADSSSLQANTSNTVVGEMISLMNAENIADAQNANGAERIDINLETVFAADPEYIVVQCHSDVETAKKKVEETYGGNAVWNSLTAVKEGKVYFLEKTLFHNKPNRRFGEAYQILAEILYPEIAK